MDSNTNNVTTLVFPPKPLTNEARKVFWRFYEEWVLNASDEELEQLQAALEEFGTVEVQSLASVIRSVLQDEVQKRKFPASFLIPLQVASWPGASAHG